LLSRCSRPVCEFGRAWVAAEMPDNRAKKLAEFGASALPPKAPTADAESDDVDGSDAPRPQRYRIAPPRVQTDQIIHIQRQLRKKRREELAELQPSSSRARAWTTEASSRSASSASSRAPVDVEDANEQNVNAAAGAAAVVSAGESPSSRPGSSASPSRGRNRPVYKIDRCHRDMVRKQVWLQKFDFLYRQVETEMEKDKHNSFATSSSANNGALGASAIGLGATGGSTAALGASLGGHAGAGAAAGGAASSSAANAVGTMEAITAAAMLEIHGPRRASRSVGHSSEIHALAVALRASLINGTAPGAAAGGAQGVGNVTQPTLLQGISSRPVSAGTMKGPPSEMPSATASVAAAATDHANSSAADSSGTPSLSGRSRGGWSSTGGSCMNATHQRARAVRAAAPARSQSSSRCGSRAGSRPVGSRPARKARGIGLPCSAEAPLPRLLASSASMPCVLAADRDLRGVRDEYYGGDELLMHEDILHCSNPRLFPLEPNRINKPFRLESLVVC